MILRKLRRISTGTALDRGAFGRCPAKWQDPAAAVWLGPRSTAHGQRLAMVDPTEPHQ